MTMTAAEAAHYDEHIHDVVDLNQADISDIIDKIVVQGDAECVDDNCEHGAVELAGSLWQLFHFNQVGRLGSSLKKAKVERIRVLSHEDCGFLAVILGLYTRAEQNWYADGSRRSSGANDVIKNQLLAYGVLAVWADRDGHGSATDYMAFMRSR